jgi:hypothetical protein
MNYMLLQNSILLANHSSVITGFDGAGVLRLQTPPLTTLNSTSPLISCFLRAQHPDFFLLVELRHFLAAAHLRLHG